MNKKILLISSAILTTSVVAAVAIPITLLKLNSTNVENKIDLKIENKKIDTSFDNKAKFTLVLRSKQLNLYANNKFEIALVNSQNPNEIHKKIFSLTEFNNDKNEVKSKIEFTNLIDNQEYKIKKISFVKEKENQNDLPKFIYENLGIESNDKNYFAKFKTKKVDFQLTKINFLRNGKEIKDNQFSESDSISIELSYNKATNSTLKKKAKITFSYEILENGNKVKKEIETISENAINSNTQELIFKIQPNTLRKNTNYKIEKIEYQVNENNWENIKIDEKLISKNFSIISDFNAKNLDFKYLKNESNINKLVVESNLENNNNLFNNKNITIKYFDVSNENKILETNNVEIIKSSEGSKKIRFEINDPKLNTSYKIKQIILNSKNDLESPKLKQEFEINKVIKLANEESQIKINVLEFSNKSYLNEKVKLSFKIENEKFNLKDQNNKSYFKAILKNVNNNLVISEKTSLNEDNIIEFEFSNLSEGNYALESIVISNENKINTLTNGNINEFNKLVFGQNLIKEKIIKITKPVQLNTQQQENWKYVSEVLKKVVENGRDSFKEFSLHKKTEIPSPISFYDLSQTKKEDLVDILSFTLSKDASGAYKMVAEKIKTLFNDNLLEFDIVFSLLDDFNGYIAQNTITFGLKGHQEKQKIILKNIILNDLIVGQENIKNTLDNNDLNFNEEQKNQWMQLRKNKKTKFDVQPITIVDLENKKLDSNELRDKIRKFSLVVEALRRSSSASTIGNRLSKLGGLSKLNVAYKFRKEVSQGSVKFINKVIITPKSSLNNQNEKIEFDIELLVLNKITNF
uniref:Hypothetical membrane protein P93 n=1 Tax=Mycoplasmopsis pulmonis TaxID=2107 RepID=Q9L8P7_MYCPL|nr:hypothetical membrane protein P93 [Mycoplasmopsis pulmonis]